MTLICQDRIGEAIRIHDKTCWRVNYVVEGTLLLRGIFEFYECE